MRVWGGREGDWSVLGIMSRRWVPTKKRRGRGGVLVVLVVVVLVVLLDELLGHEEGRWKVG